MNMLNTKTHRYLLGLICFAMFTTGSFQVGKRIKFFRRRGGVLLEQSSGWGFGLRGHAGSHPAARRAPPRNAEVSPETLGYLPAAQSVMCILSGLASSMMAPGLLRR